MSYASDCLDHQRVVISDRIKTNLKRTNLTEKQKRWLDSLVENYPNPVCELHYQNRFELLIAVLLSAQTTDKRVNLVTKNLFELASTPEGLAQLPLACLENLLRPLGLFRIKAKRIQTLSQQIVACGLIPTNRSELLALTGVGRKTANVFLNLSEKQPLIGVDTHVSRVSIRMGLTKKRTPLQIEHDLMEKISASDRVYFNLRCVQHARRFCKSRRPLCQSCPLKTDCLYVPGSA